jgi:predicted enzyme related to lactoylglutathione lyase
VSDTSPTAPTSPTPTNLAHFAVNADDVDGARRFYEAVLGWRFHAWGPPGFFQIETGGEGDPGIRGALQQRRELLPGVRTVGFECTFAVDDVDAVAEAVVANGGEILMEKTTITGVGDLIWFRDPDGNALGAMRYDTSAE